MTEQEKLYEVLGEFLFAVAIADGVIQDEERAAMASLLADHPWGKNVQWSFDYEEKKSTNLATAYSNAIDACKNHGPSPIYAEFESAMKKVAEAANGTDEDEARIINSFSVDLIEKFQEDLNL